MTDIKQKGALGERIAVNYLLTHSCLLIKQNFKTRMGEIDIIYKTKNNTLVFCEVKNHKMLDFTLDHIALKQKNRIQKAAQIFLGTYAHDGDIRFDVILITDNQVSHHFKNI